jgi:hypothetical protein
MSGGVAGRAGCVKTGTLASTAAAASSRNADDGVRVTALIIPKETGFIFRSAPEESMKPGLISVSAPQEN